MALYEHVFLARQEITQSQVEALLKEYSECIAEGGGTVGKIEYWGLKNLAYKIKKNRKAHFALMNIDAPPAAIAEMERRQSIATDILRTLTMRVEAHETEPSIQMRKADRDERGDREGRFGDRGGRGGGGFGRGGDRGGGFRSDRPRGDRPPREDRGTFRPRPRPDGAAGPQE